MSSQVIRRIAALLAGNGLAQIIQFIALIPISRMYTPADFGILSKAQSLGTVAAIVMTLQMHLVIPLCRNRKDVESVFCSVVTVALFMLALFAAPVLLMGREWGAGLAIGLCVGLVNTCVSVLVYESEFARIARIYVCRAVVIVLFQALFSLTNFQNALLWAVVLGESLVAIYLLSIQSSRSSLRLVRPHQLVQSLFKYKKFSIYGTGQELVSVVAFFLPLMLFAKKYGDAVAGQYGMANRLVWAPIVLLSGSIAPVLYQRYGQQSLSLGVLVKEMAGVWWVPILGFVASVCGFLVPVIFVRIFGENWVMAGEIVPYQLMSGCFFLCSTPFRVLLRVLGCQSVQLGIEVLSVFFIGIIFFVDGFNPIDTAAALVTVSFIQLFSCICVVLRALQLRNHEANL